MPKIPKKMVPAEIIVAESESVMNRRINGKSMAMIPIDDTRELKAGFREFLPTGNNVIYFTRAFNDGGEFPLSAEGPTPVIWALGPSVKFLGYHERRGASSIDLRGAPMPSLNECGKWEEPAECGGCDTCESMLCEPNCEIHCVCAQGYARLRAGEPCQKDSICGATRR